MTKSLDTGSGAGWASRLDGELGAESPSFIEDCPTRWAEAPRPVRRATLVTWITCEFDRAEHAISDDEMTIGSRMGTGRYAALCASTVYAASLMCPPGQRCPSCQILAQRTNRPPPPRKTRIFARWRGRRRRMTQQIHTLSHPG